jgi:hypothetical protein
VESEEQKERVVYNILGCGRCDSTDDTPKPAGRCTAAWTKAYWYGLYPGRFDFNEALLPILISPTSVASTSQTPVKGEERLREQLQPTREIAVACY